MKRILTIIGNRPQLMKVDNKLEQTIVWTGQHYDECMKDVFFKELNIPEPKYNLNETKLGAMIDKIDEIIKIENPDYVLVYGDTNSTLAGALATKQNRKKLIHVEAGMRSGNMEMIEEQNRKIVDSISDVLLCPCRSAVEILDKEQVFGRVGECGNVMIDTLWSCVPVEDLKEELGEFYLLTIHRAETVDNKEALEEIFGALKITGKKFIFPIHPRTRKNIEEFKIVIPENVEVINPVGYKKMLSYLGSCQKVLTDSGGIQVEAFFLRKPCITLRNETEWTDTVAQGWNKIVGTDKFEIVKAIDSKINYGLQSTMVYGNGSAKEAIRNYLQSL
jgi:UDP-GlcNAc3NAcA epimerase